MKNLILSFLVLLAPVTLVTAQDSATGEQRVSLSETAIARDATGLAVLEGTLRTTVLNGAADTPVTNTFIVIKNVSPLLYSYVTGLVTFYDGSGVRCGEGIFKADMLASGEAFETDTPGIRIRCAAASWRIVTTNLVPRVQNTFTTAGNMPATSNLIISVDGEEHPIQLDRPMVLQLGNLRRTVVVRQLR